MSDKPAQTELSILRDRAGLMGIKFSNTTTVEELKKKIDAKMNGAPEPEENVTNPLAPEAQAESKMSLRERLHKECMQLIRCRITNLDPKKKDLNGEIFTVANEYVGNITKFIPYGEATDEGYHIPKILFDELESRRFLNIRSRKDAVTGHTTVETSYAKEFAIDILPTLTQAELNKLAAAQKAAGG